MRRAPLLPLPLVLATVLAARPAWGTGEVAGTVEAGDAPAAPAPSKIAKDASVCGREAASEVLVVGDRGGLANVVVSLKGVKPQRPPAPTPGAAVDQVGCRYTPHVQAVTVGTTLDLLNNDAVLHNVHGLAAVPGGRQVTVFNVAMPFKGQKLPTVLKRPGVLKLRCDAGHTWMSAWVHVLDHPYFAVTDRSGAFRIKNVPPGSYQIEYWHEPLDDKQPPFHTSAPVVVGAGEVTRANVTMSLR